MRSDEPRPAAEMAANGGVAFRVDYLSALRAGSGRAADRVVERALDAHVSVNDIYLSIFQATAYEIGRLWQRNEFSVAQEHLATAIIERQMGDLHHQFKARRDRKRTLVIGSVDRELHRVGSRMVADFFEQDGWTVHYLGAAVPSDIAILPEL
jgi:methanogenic corrinoid protein MtbC1